MVSMQKEEGAAGLREARGGEAERKTEVVFLFGAHNLDYVKKMRELTERRLPNVIVLEEPKNAGLEKMLKGEISVEEYVNSRAYTFKEAAKERCELLVELHKKGVRIEQIDPGHGLVWKKGVAHPFSFDEAAGNRFAMHIAAGNFEKAVDTAVNLSAITAVEIKKRDEMRAKEIAAAIKKGELSGYILVEAGSIHTRTKNLLNELLKGEQVAVKAEFARKEAAKEVFGEWAQEVFSPLDELRRIYANGLQGELDRKWEKRWAERWRRDEEAVESEGGRLKALKERVRGVFDREYGGERERLLGARSVVLFKITGDDVEEDIKQMKAVGMVNRLTYEECKEVFQKTSGMNEDEAFAFLEEYLKTKK